MDEQTTPEGLTWSVSDGGTHYTVPGNSTLYGWKLEAGSPGMLWTDEKSFELEQCVSITFDDIGIELDDDGQVRTRFHGDIDLKEPDAAESASQDEPFQFDGLADAGVQEPVELDEQIIPNQVDEVGADVSFDIGSFLSEHLVNEQCTLQLSGMPPGLAYNAARMRVEGNLSDDVMVGHPYRVTMTIRTGDGKVLKSGFEWTVRDVRLVDKSELTTMAVPALSNRDEASSSAILFAVAAQAAIASRSFTLSKAGEKGDGSAASSSKALAGILQRKPLEGSDGEANLYGEEDAVTQALSVATPGGKSGGSKKDAPKAQLLTSNKALPELGSSDSEDSGPAETPLVSETPDTGGGGGGFDAAPTNDPPFAGTPPVVGVFEDGFGDGIDVLSAAYDIDGDAVSLVSATASFGEVTVNGDGTLSYQPNPNFYGQDSVNYVISDSAGNTAEGVLTIDVISVNDAPVLGTVSDTVTNEDQAVTNTVLTGASDIEGDSLSVISASAAHGTVTINGDNTLTFIPYADYNGTDTVVFTISDGNGGNAGGNYSVVVNAVNDAPVAGTLPPEAGSEDVVLANIDVLSAAFDVDGDSLSVTGAVAGNGTVIINIDNKLTYTPDLNYNGTDTISYTITDGNGGVVSSTVDVVVAPVNDAPDVGTIAPQVTDEDVVLSPIDVLSAASDVDGDGLNVSLASALHGSVTLNGDGTLSYHPDADYFGPDTISYTVSDGNGGNTVGTVSVTVNDINDAPTALADSGNVVEDSSVVIDVLANDGDFDGTLVPATVQITGTTSAGDPLVVPGQGTWSVNPATGAITFTPQANYDGPVADITYRVRDDDGTLSNAVPVSVTISSVNDTPTAADDNAVVVEDGVAVINVLGNDGDLDGTLVPSTVQITGTTSPGDPLVVAGQGTWSVNPFSGAISFTPLANYDGPVTDITYTVDDDSGATSNPATVSVTISPVNDVPVATFDSDTVVEDGSVTIDILANDTDLDGTLVPASVHITGTTLPGDSLVVPGQGTWSVNTATGAITFAPLPNYNGAVTDITYTVDDDSGATSNPVSVSVSIIDVNDTPTAAADNAVVVEDGVAVINVLSNDGDLDGTLVPSTVQITGTASPGDPLVVAGQGTWSVNPFSGAISFTPLANYDGPVTDITYTVDDDSGATSNPATVSVTISPVNDVPVATFDSDTVVEDGSVTIDVLANDTDLDGTLVPASVHITGTTLPGDSLVVPGQGTWSVNTTTGAITFTPLPNYSGPVTDITYRVDDNDGATSNPVSVSVLITEVNDTPTAEANGDLVAEDGTVMMNVLGNDWDLDGTLVPSTVQITGTASPGDPLVVPGQGTWTVNPFSGAISFTPLANYDGPVTSITYTVDDNDGATSNPATVSVLISSVNDAPTALADSDTVLEDGSVTIDVLANDSDLDGTLVPATVQITGTASAGDTLIVAGQGSWSVNAATGAITFTPLTNYTGPVSDITYTVDDNSGATSSLASVSVSISEVNDAPTAFADSGVVAEDGFVVVNALGNDSDLDGTLVPSTVQITGTTSPGDPLVVAAQGTWSVNSTTGAISFIPLADYAGPVTDITYRVQDDDGALSNAVPVSVTIIGSNDDPVAGTVPDAATNEDVAVNLIDVLSFATDVDGDAMTVIGASALNGTVTINGDSTLNYTPDADYNGTDTISFTIDDGNGGVDAGSVDVVVAPVNDAPDAGSPPLSNTNEDNGLVSIDVLGFASDIDGDSLSVTSPTALNGSVSVNLDGTLNYTPNTNFNGLDTITYTVDDGNGGTAIGTKFIFVSPINDAPVALDDSASVAEDSSVTVNVLGNDSDVDGVLLASTVQTTGTPSPGDPLVVAGEGTWSVNGTTGEITFTPEVNYNGSVTDITYTVRDNAGLTSPPATVQVTINAVNDAPVLDLSNVEDLIVNGSFSDGSKGDWTGWIEVGDFDDGGSGSNAPAMTHHDEDGFVSVTQTGLSGLSDGPGAHGAALVMFDMGWSDHNADHESSPIQVTLLVAGVDYAQITTSNGGGSTASVTYLNGASGPPTIITSSEEKDWIYYPVQVNLPASVADSGSIRLRLQNLSDDDDDHTDEASIDNVQVFVNEPNSSDLDTQVAYTAGDPPIALLDSSSSISDTDDTTLQSARIILTNAESGDQLLVNGSVAGNGSSGTVSGLTWSSVVSGGSVQIDISGSGSHATYLAALQQIAFNNTLSGPVASARVIDMTINDGVSDSSVSQARVLLGVDLQPPDAQDDSASGFEDVPLVINVLTNDVPGDELIDPTTILLQDTSTPGDPLVVPGEGTWTVNTVTGQIIFTGEPEYSGTPTPIQYSVSDINGLGSAPAQVSVTIASVNDIPAATIDGDTVVEDGSVTIDVLANDSDIDGTIVPSSVQITGTASAGDPLVVPGQGTWSVNTTTSAITFTPLANYDGPVTDITYTVEDNDGGTSSPTTVAVTISPVNDVPSSSDDSDSVLEDGSVTIDVLANDTDIDGTLVPTTVQIAGTASAGDPLVVPGQGTWSINTSTGAITFTPLPDYTGPVSDISYIVEDNDGATTGSATVSVTISSVNDAPVALADSDTVTEDGSVIIDVLANDSDLEGTLVPASVQITGTASAGDPLFVPGQGTWSVNTTTGAITFTPLPDYDGLVTDITYTVDDNGGATSSPTAVSVTINPVNDVPTASADSDSVAEDGSVTINVLANDSDVDGTLQPSTVQITGTASPGDSLVVPGQGTWSVNTITGAITFTPLLNYTGSVTDIFYTVEDDSGATSSPAAVSVTITDVNDAPVAIADSDTVTEDGSVTIDVLANDSDFDGVLVPSTVQITGTTLPGDPFVVPGQGTWSINSTTGAITFTPLANYDGVVTDITYRVRDDDGTLSNTVPVSVTINPVNDVPVAVFDGDTVLEDGSIVINVLANDSDLDGTLVPSSVQIVGTTSPGDPLVAPGQGTWSINTTTGAITFTPLANYTGPVTDIVYTVDDNSGATSNPVSVSVVISPVNDAPLTGADSDTVVEDGSVTIDVLSNDSDIEGTLVPASVHITGATLPGDPLVVPGQGTWSVNTTTGEITFTPLPDYDGPVTDITYTVDDNAGATSSPTPVSVTITPVNDAPTAAADSDTVLEDGSIVINVLANDNDVDGTLQPATVHITGTTLPGDSLVVPGQGTWSVNTTTGAITFAPIPDYNGPVTDITYTVDDNSGVTSSPASVSVTIAPVNDVPTGLADSDTVVEDGSVVIDVLANDSDLDGTLVPASVHIAGTLLAGDPLVVPGQGTWSVNTTTGAITFTPLPDYDGPVTDITYTVDDDAGGTSSATIVSVTITPVNDAPTASADSDTVLEDGAIVINVLANDNDVDGTLQPATVQITGTTLPGDPLVVPGQGTWSVNTTTGAITFTPLPDYDGPVTDITYTVDDNNGVTSSPATVSVTITPVNDVPTALADSDTVSEDGSVVIDVLANDSDLDGTLVPSTVQISGTASPGDPWIAAGEGTWSINSTTGEITFAPLTSYTGAVTDITYTVDDDGGATSSPASVSVSIIPLGVNLTGTSGADILTGGAFSDTIQGLNGNDTIDGLAGDEFLFGDGGSDTITGGAGDDTIDAGTGGGDILVYSGNRADYIVHDNQDGTYLITDTRPGSPDGTDTVITSGSLEDLQFADQTVGLATAVTAVSPIAFDLSGDGAINVTGQTTAQNKDGVTEIGETVSFDMDGDGDLETIEWLDGSGDGLLVDNRDGRAADDMNGTRLFGDQGGQYDHGYQQLAELDADGNSVISGDEMQGLSLWVDDGNTVVDDGELFSLAEMEISEISLKLDEQAEDEQGRNLFQSSATKSDGQKILTEDVWFAESNERENHPLDKWDDEHQRSQLDDVM